MKYEKDIAAHVISNIALVESAYLVIDDVENTIFKRLNSVIKKHVEDSELKLGKDNKFELYSGDDGLYFSTIGWETQAKEQVAYYCFNFGGDETEDLFHLTHLLGEYSKNAALHLQFVMDKNELGLNLRKFKSNLRTVFLKSEGLLNLGFQLSSCNECIELKMHLDKSEVADEYPDLDESFKPIITALNTLFEAHHHFEKMVDEMKVLVEASSKQKEVVALGESEQLIKEATVNE